jgi:hypothetical protein
VRQGQCIVCFCRSMGRLRIVSGQADGCKEVHTEDEDEEGARGVKVFFFLYCRHC